MNVWYEAEDYNFSEGPTEILECGVQSVDDPSQVHKSTDLKRYERHVEAKTPALTVGPGKTVRLWEKQFNTGEFMIACGRRLDSPS